MVLFAISLCVVLLIQISVTIDDYSEKDTQLSGAAGELLDGHMKLDRDAPPAMHQALNQRYDEITKSIEHEADEKLWWDIGFAFGLLTTLSYALQSIYRAIIYVAYGNGQRSEPEGDRRT